MWSDSPRASRPEHSRGRGPLLPQPRHPGPLVSAWLGWVQDRGASVLGSATTHSRPGQRAKPAERGPGATPGVQISQPTKAAVLTGESVTKTGRD